jgi:CRP/FNR family cyclic AMP-dependent transcriptional regulator
MRRGLRRGLSHSRPARSRPCEIFSLLFHRVLTRGCAAAVLVNALKRALSSAQGFIIGASRQRELPLFWSAFVWFLEMTIDTLRQVPLFESLDNEAAGELCRLLESLDCKADTFLFRAGDEGNAMYIIERGKVRICVQTEDGREVTLTELRRGDFFGEMALLDGQRRRSADARVAEDARLAVLSRDHFLSFMRSSPDVALEMLTALANRLRRTDELLRHSATRNVNVEEAAQFTLADRAADVIAEFGGSWKFIIAAVLFFNSWVLINSFVNTRFDAYPFLLLTTVTNMLALLQAPIILMSQNRQAHKDRLRSEIDYQVNLKNELALNEILDRLKTLERDYLRRASDDDRDKQGA